jgi:hypothetical protein
MITTSAVRPICPTCKTDVFLRAPHVAVRVVCANCRALLEVEQGQLKLFRQLKDEAELEPQLPLGATGVLQGHEFTVIGRVVRTITWSSEPRAQAEYLLHNPQTGLRRLSCCEGHWSLAEPIAEDEVLNIGNYSADCRARHFQTFALNNARTKFLDGEFHWRIIPDRPVKLWMLISPPYLLTRAQSKASGKDKSGLYTEWWLAQWLEPLEAERAFGLEPLPRTTAIAPHQPFPYKPVYRYWRWLALLLSVLWIVAIALSKERQVFEQTFQLEPTQGSEETRVFFSEPFELKARQNLRAYASAPIDNSWLYVEGDLINEETGLVQQFGFPIEYYYGYEEGEHWTEGDTSGEEYLSALPPGKYTLRLEVQWEHWSQPLQVTVGLQQGVPRFWPFLLVLLALSVIPSLLLLYEYKSFEPRRWQGNPFMPERYRPKDDDD